MEDERGDTELEETKLHAGASELESAIVRLLQAHDPQANEWITQFASLPYAWSVSLYLAFPPPGSTLGTSPDVRFFALNLLLSKMRSDWSQVAGADAQEIYEVLMRQLPLNLGDRMVGARLCVVLSSAAALAGADACYELVESIVGGEYTGPTVDGPLAVELLISLAEETLLRSRALPWQVGECMQDCSSQVLAYLQSMVTSPLPEEVVARAFVCLERWIQAGVTLSELYSLYAPLLKTLLDALGSKNDTCFDTAVTTLSELISAVDLLPGREPAVQATISAIVAQKGHYVTAALELSESTRKRAGGLLSLVSALGSAEPYLLARGGNDAATVLDWLVDGLGGGGGLGLEGAAMAVEAWPRLAAVPRPKRVEVLQGPFFAAAAQAIMRVAMYPAHFYTWDQSVVEEDDFYRFREGPAKEALCVCFKELGDALLSHIVNCLHQAATWQHAEVCLFVAASLSKEVLATIGISSQSGTRVAIEGDETAAKSFLLAIIGQLPGSSPVIQKDKSNWPHARLVEMAARALERYADWAATETSSLETCVSYTVGALYIPDARGRAAIALRELCRAAAPHIAAARALAALMGACEEAVAASVGVSDGGLEAGDRLAIIQGLAAVATALPPEEACLAFAHLTSTAISTVKALAEARERTEDSGSMLAEALRVIAAATEFGVPPAQSVGSHPGLMILQDIWPALEKIASHWPAYVDVSSALCELWGLIAQKVGVVLSGVLPAVIKAATAMFKQHLVAACLDCLSNIVALVSVEANATSQVEESLAENLLQVTTAINDLEHMVASKEEYKVSSGLHTLAGMDDLEKKRGKQQQTEVLGAVCRLGRSFLQGRPSILLPSPAFLNIIHCAIGCVQRREVGPALAAAKFMAEAVICVGLSDNGDKDNIEWRLPQELVPHVDTAVGFYGALMVEVVLKAISRMELVEDLRDALADVLYGLCLRYAAASETAMLAVLNSANFPARCGVLTESDKKLFVAAAVKQPLHPRRRFQELVGDFGRVCQAQMPSEVLAGYQRGL